MFLSLQKVFSTHSFLPTVRELIASVLPSEEPQGKPHPAKLLHGPWELPLWHLPKGVRGAQGKVPVPESLESIWALD